MASSRQHYVAVADVLYRERQATASYDALDSIQRVTERMADIFTEENPNFDRERFMDAVQTGAGLQL